MFECGENLHFRRTPFEGGLTFLGSMLNFLRPIDKCFDFGLFLQRQKHISLDKSPGIVEKSSLNVDSLGHSIH